MNKLYLSEAQMSVALEQRLLHLWGDELPDAVRKMQEAFRLIEEDRALMDKSTGSTSIAACVFLYLLARHFGPSRICEVGTFIGRSTTALALGNSRSNPTVLYTCDKDNDCFLDSPIERCEIVPHARTASPQMLGALAARGEKIDLFFFDGRLSDEDVPLIHALAHPESVFAFDDFEGTEKGVANMILLQDLRQGARLLCPPTRNQALLHLGIAGSHTIAVLLPVSLVRFAHQ